MKITLFVVGKTDNPNIEGLSQLYTQRLKHYINVTIQVIPDIKNAKNLSESQQKKSEAAAVLKKNT